MGNLIARVFSLFKMAGWRNPDWGCQNGSKNWVEFFCINTMKCLRFVWTTVSDCRRQTGLPDTGNNLWKSHFIVSHVTKYSTILGVFQQPWPGVSPIRHFEWGEGPVYEVELCGEQSELMSWEGINCKANFFLSTVCLNCAHSNLKKFSFQLCQVCYPFRSCCKLIFWQSSELMLYA